jgi:DNA (cytosine-5)-methyltransferase 1
LGGQRSGLWWEFHRIVAELAPRWVLIENVPGLLSSCGCEECRSAPDTVDGVEEDEEAVAERVKPEHRGRDMLAVVEGLAELGYGWAYRVLDAQHFGVPQRRRRVFIVGHLGEPFSAAAAVLFEPESCERYPATSRTARTAVATSADGGAARDVESSHHLSVSNARIETDTEAFVVETAIPLTAGSPSMLGVRPPGRRKEDDYNLVVSTLQGGGRRGHRIDAEGGAGGHDIPIESSVRRLTPVECERLQGLPDGWTAEGTDGPHAESTRYRHCGNAVAVPVAKWIGRRLIQRWGPVDMAWPPE